MVADVSSVVRCVSWYSISSGHCFSPLVNHDHLHFAYGRWIDLSNQYTMPEVKNATIKVAFRASKLALVVSRSASGAAIALA